MQSDFRYVRHVSFAPTTLQLSRLRIQTPEPKTRNILSERYAVDLILRADARKEILAHELREVHSSYINTPALTRRFAELGLLKIVMGKSPRVTYWISLSSKGEKPAEKLREAKELWGNEF